VTGRELGASHASPEACQWSGDWRSKSRSLWGAIKRDLAAAAFSSRLLLIATAAVVLIHEFGMEFVLGNVGSRTFEAARNPFEAGLAMGLTSLVVEVVLTVLVSLGLTRFGHVAALMADRQLALAETTPMDATASTIVAIIDIVTFALALGSPGVILRSYANDPDRSTRSNLLTGLAASLALAMANFFIGALAAGGLWITDSLGHASVTNVILSILKSPLTYVGLFLLGRLIKWFDTARKRSVSVAEAE